MSRYCGEVNTTPILNAAGHWREVALLGGRSVFSEKRLWTVEGLAALDKHFVRNLDDGDRNIWVKLKDQLAPTPPAVKQLAAEMIWLMYLCPSNISARHKRQTINAVWSWSGEPFPNAALTWLDDAVLAGIGSGGPGFNQYQWLELAFIVNFMSAFRRLTMERQREVSQDGWKFAEWLKEVPEWRSRQMRHMLLLLLFPDDFERIFGKQDRRRVAQVFGGLDAQAVNRLDPVELDRTLRQIRTKLEREYGTQELDYYVPPLKHRWNSEGAAGVLETINAAHVRQAIEEITRGGVPADAESTGYDLIQSGQRFPPKLVLSRAAKFATGDELDRGAFSGGEDSSAFRFLRKLGFEIEAKDAIPDLIRKFLEQANAGTDLRVRGYLPQYRSLTVKVGFGQGVFSRIPWIAFLSPGQQVSKGVYPVLLLFREQKVLLLCYGVSEENQAVLSWGNLGQTRTVQSWFRERFDRNPDRYGSSFVRAAYDLSLPLPIEDLGKQLDLLIDEYKGVLGRHTNAMLDELRDTPSVTPTQETPPREDIGEAVRSFAGALRDSFVSFGASHDDLVAAFVASVVTKPLVILTGLSGSGKTQIAVRFGEWLGKGRLHVAAVRPDWTGAEFLFGYEDGLRPAVDGRAAWNVPAPLEFMLRALRDPQYPYLLVLDEMNLAHVERYFADMLSGMESGHPCIPNLRQGTDMLWRCEVGQEPFLPFPRNLWIVGTVNVDETTYMFSPKVLDRSNTFEFRVTTDDLQFDSKKPRAAEVGDPALVRGLLAMAQNNEWHQSNAASFGGPFSNKLKQLHGVLSRYGLEFGHRSFYEAVRFAAFAEKSGLEGMEATLDRVVMQKVLPRLHGARRRLELPILSLLHFSRDLPELVAGDQDLQALTPEATKDASPKLPISHDKLSRMLRALRANQFASFTE